MIENSLMLNLHYTIYNSQLLFLPFLLLFLFFSFTIVELSNQIFHQSSIFLHFIHFVFFKFYTSLFSFFFLFSLPHKNRFWFRSLIAVFHYTILDFLFPRFIFFFPCKPFHPFHPGPHFSLFSNAKVFDFYIPNFPSLSFLFYTFIDFLNSDKPILFRGLSWRTFRNRSTHQRSLSAFSTNPQLIVSETPRFHQTFNL